ncbi:leader peptidase (prepilin peptidase) / N-methyltransferase [Amycolatopsis marina]|uniref:Leader peptidase (Prepilin peptidase) / N-methyltransferase n=1 Tax=Amycolatopsis marina TaxID=490629 RepID=A0A1I1CR94_9PSEU|nr:prepilin peptidase [Amycolatopsis marina]SFB63110.1 leader peptidase (prepilin peptidase) / N-methyltransferase [Amycolatopsis marina]
MQVTASGFWTVGVAAGGLVLGTVASGFTRRFLRRERVLAGSWWLGAVLTAAVLGLLAWRVGARGELVVYGFVAVLAVPLAVIDWCEHRLPRALVYPQLASACVGFTVLSVVRSEAAPSVRALGALVAAGALFLVLAVVSGGGVGAGDLSVAAVVGVVAGWSGWPEVAGALLMASVLALILLAVPSARRRDEHGGLAVPFGPCLFLGALIMLTLSG